MNYIFEVIDKSRRKIRLTKRQWSHICKKHPEVEDFEMIENVLIYPDKIINNYYDKTNVRYYKYFKEREKPNQYLLVIIKYLNGDGYVITAFFDKHM